VASRFNDQSSKFSPDSRLLAYSSSEGGRQEVFVEDLADRRRWQVSTNGGDEPEWRGDGKELFFVDADDALTSVEITRKEGALSMGSPRKLFRAPRYLRRRNRYVATPDGKRFLIITPEPEPARANIVVLNWPLLLNKSAGQP
jgi:Tol biopolymer transport system component